MYVCIGLVCLIDDEDGDCGGGGGDECDGVLGVKRGTPSLALLQKRTRGEGEKGKLFLSCRKSNPILVSTLPLQNLSHLILLVVSVKKRVLIPQGHLLFSSAFLFFSFFLSLSDLIELCVLLLPGFFSFHIFLLFSWFFFFLFFPQSCICDLGLGFIFFYFFFKKTYFQLLFFQNLSLLVSGFCVF